jgi:hypothetical protein
MFLALGRFIPSAPAVDIQRTSKSPSSKSEIS